MGYGGGCSNVLGGICAIEPSYSSLINNHDIMCQFQVSIAQTRGNDIKFKNRFATWVKILTHTYAIQQYVTLMRI